MRPASSMSLPMGSCGGCPSPVSKDRERTARGNSLLNRGGGEESAPAEERSPYLPHHRGGGRGRGSTTPRLHGAPAGQVGGGGVW